MSIVSSSMTEDVESLKAPSLSSGSCSEGEEEGTPVREVGVKLFWETSAGKRPSSQAIVKFCEFIIAGSPCE